ncbi:MAG: phosphate acyltransferase, partial [Roseibacillus sp.]|nr:phosphate acyltransferase [Roseibacillus sp.]
MKIALDAMGGDRAPEVNIVGARDALSLYPRIDTLFLTGDADTLKKECRKHDLTDSRMEIVHAPEVVGMSESAVNAIRRK